MDRARGGALPDENGLTRSLRMAIDLDFSV